MNNDAEESFAYCDDLVRRRDEDRWLAARYAPAALRGRLYALYALHHEISSAVGKAKEPALGEMRLVWWREAVGEARRAAARDHPVLEAVRAAAIIDDELEGRFGAMIDARRRRLDGAPFSDIDALEEYLSATEGYLALLAARVLHDLDARLEAGLRDAAVGYALARNGPRLAPALANETGARAEALHRNVAKALRDLPPGAAPAALHFALTPLYLDGRPSALARRFRLFLAMATGRL